MDWNNYRGISLLSFVGKVHSSLLEKRVRVIVEPLLNENQSDFGLCEDAKIKFLFWDSW